MAACGMQGVDAVWVFANLGFTAMRAQEGGTTFWKVVSVHLRVSRHFAVVAEVDPGANALMEWSCHERQRLRELTNETH